ncbi:GNAT family N-acetyltransferase [Saccharopolyspora griseoalba]|uniref:GNAT family N-acetyltransferase n=1 Tax=Saccharopolyspora griseoalba TaxID=1431848 RepID=A0ABW2LTE9_9PSEU
MCTGGDRLMMVAVGVPYRPDRPVVVEIVRAPARVPAGITYLDVYVDGVPVGDLLLRVCEPCERAVIEHLRIDHQYTRQGLGRRLVEAATAQHPGYAWSTTEISDAPSARGFAAAASRPARRCRRGAST